MPDSRSPDIPPVLPWRIAAPSWVVPGGPGENCRLLARHRRFFDEVELLFFETRACLAYTEADLPADLARLGLSFHVHLPADLDWSRGAAGPAEVIAALAAKAAHLAPRAYVLHPPPDPALLGPLARALAAAGLAPGDLLLENVRGHDLTAAWPDLVRHGLSACLDLGHLLAYGQQRLLEIPDLWDRVRMLHCCAPGPDGRHLGLARLDPAGRACLGRMLERLDPAATVAIEVFDLAECLDSRRVLAQIAPQGRTP
ncbi:MAG: cobamide remodeling phosphodiesterase CbiR [Desulfovibrionaceae bacterium]